MASGAGTADGLRRIIRTRAAAVARNAADDLKAQLVTAAQPHRGTGKMIAAISVTAYAEGDGRWRLTARCPVPEAIFTNDGTRAHTIYPRFAKVLAFIPKGGTQVVFAAHANIPAHPGDRWFSNVMTRPNVQATLRRNQGLQ